MVFTGAKVLALMMIIISGLWVLSRGIRMYIDSIWILSLCHYHPVLLHTIWNLSSPFGFLKSGKL